MASKKAAGRKPKGYIDDIWKAMQAARKAGNNKKADELMDKFRRETAAAMNKAAGDKELRNQWSRIVTKSLKTDERAAKATGAAKAREEARSRGIRARSEAMGARQEADISKARAEAAAKAKARKDARARGGVNSPSNVKKRQNRRGGGRSAR